MKTQVKILSETLPASSRGKEIYEAYRAVLVRDDDNQRLLVNVEQPIKGAWYPAGSWYLSTLLYGYPVDLHKTANDSISIDFGQQWQIDKGMREALLNAITEI